MHTLWPTNPDTYTLLTPRRAWGLWLLSLLVPALWVWEGEVRSSLLGWDIDWLSAAWRLGRPPPWETMAPFR